jgi:hypothetical protein
MCSTVATASIARKAEASIPVKVSKVGGVPWPGAGTLGNSFPSRSIVQGGTMSAPTSTVVPSSKCETGPDVYGLKLETQSLCTHAPGRVSQSLVHSTQCSTILAYKGIYTCWNIHMWVYTRMWWIYVHCIDRCRCCIGQCRSITTCMCVCACCV